MDIKYQIFRLRQGYGGQANIKKKGFTLLELLVVISIIGILIALGTVSYSAAQKKARDSKRRGDMKSLQNAMEQYSAQNNRYAQNNTELTTMLQGSMPTDPKTGSSYIITDADSYDQTAPVGEKYCICALLELTGTGNASANASGASCTFGSGNYFCVQNLQ